MSDTTVWGTIDDQEITFPMDVANFNGLTLMYTVPLEPAQALVAGDAFEVLETAPGMAQLIVAVCDYIDNPWGDYNEVNLGFLVRPRGAADDVMGSFVYRMPVNQEFTCEAGNRVMGFPKTVETIDIDYTESEVSIAMTCGGAPTLSIAVPRVPSPAADRTDTVSYSYLDGAPHATPLSIDMGAGFIDAGDVDLELGSGVVADELRSLGLPQPPAAAIWGEGLSATFQLGQPIEVS